MYSFKQQFWKSADVKPFSFVYKEDSKSWAGSKYKCTFLLIQQKNVKINWIPLLKGFEEDKITK